MAKRNSYRHPFTGKPISQEEYENANRVPKLRQESVDDVGKYIVREHIKDEIQKHIDEGASFPDAAEAAGLPADLAFARTFTDPDFRGMYDQARGRKVLDRRHRKFDGLDLLNPIEIKREFVQKLYAAGLFDKIAALAAHADPTTRDGQQILAFFMRNVLKDVLPNEQTSVIEHKTHKEEATDKDEILKRLDEIKAENERLAQEQAAAEKRIQELSRAKKGKK